MNSETDVSKQCYQIWQKAAIKCYQIWQKSAKITRFGKKWRKLPKLSKTGKWPKVANTDSHTSVTNCPGIKIGQSNCQKMPKNAKRAKMCSPILVQLGSYWVKLNHDQWSWCGQIVLPDWAKSHQNDKKSLNWQKFAKLAKICQSGEKLSK